MSDYGGIEDIRIDSSKIWTPDIVLVGRYTVNYDIHNLNYYKALDKESCTYQILTKDSFFLYRNIFLHLIQLNILSHNLWDFGHLTSQLGRTSPAVVSHDGSVLIVIAVVQFLLSENI